MLESSSILSLDLFILNYLFDVVVVVMVVVIFVVIVVVIAKID